MSCGISDQTHFDSITTNPEEIISMWGAHVKVNVVKIGWNRFIYYGYKLYVIPLTSF